VIRLPSSTTARSSHCAPAFSRSFRTEGHEVTYLTRVHHLDGTVAAGANAASFLDAAAVIRDGAADQLSGEGEQDWFLFAAIDKVHDQVTGGQPGEIFTGL